LLPIKTIKELENKAKMKNLQPDEKNTVLKFMVQADILVSLQRRFLSAFTLEH